AAGTSCKLGMACAIVSSSCCRVGLGACGGVLLVVPKQCEMHPSWIWVRSGLPLSLRPGFRPSARPVLAIGGMPGLLFEIGTTPVRVLETGMWPVLVFAVGIGPVFVFERLSSRSCRSVPVRCREPPSVCTVLLRCLAACTWLTPRQWAVQEEIWICQIPWAVAVDSATTPFCAPSPDWSRR